MSIFYRDILDYIKLKVGPTSRLIHAQEELVPFISLLENTQTFEQHNLLAIVLGLFVNATTEVIVCVADAVNLLMI